MSQNLTFGLMFEIKVWQQNFRVRLEVEIIVWSSGFKLKLKFKFYVAVCVWISSSTLFFDGLVWGHVLFLKFNVEAKTLERKLKLHLEVEI